jgi:thymidylate synthase (FAD)
MKLIDQSWEWEYEKPTDVLKRIERIGRVCYKSEDKITDDSAEKFVKMIIDNKHESVLEHISASVRFITMRSVTHELVRHRHCAFSQESTRYVNYKSKDIEIIRPVWYIDGTLLSGALADLFVHFENIYQSMVLSGMKPEEAREILPNALKTEIVVTTNLREWRHIFKMRTHQSAHPQIRALMLSCLEGFKKEIPIVFDDIPTKCSYCNGTKKMIKCDLEGKPYEAICTFCNVGTYTGENKMSKMVVTHEDVFNHLSGYHKIVLNVDKMAEEEKNLCVKGLYKLIKEINPQAVNISVEWDVGELR